MHPALDGILTHRLRATEHHTQRHPFRTCPRQPQRALRWIAGTKQVTALAKCGVLPFHFDPRTHGQQPCQLLGNTHERALAPARRKLFGG